MSREDIVIDKAPKTKLERWISTGFAEHTVLVRVDGVSIPVKFKNYALELNLEEPEKAKIAKALRSSSRYGRDVFLIGAAVSADDIGKRAEVWDKLQQMDIAQLAAMFNHGELVECCQKIGIPMPPTDSDKGRLIAYLVNTKSI